MGMLRCLILIIGVVSMFGVSVIVAQKVIFSTSWLVEPVEKIYLAASWLVEPVDMFGLASDRNDHRKFRDRWICLQ